MASENKWYAWGGLLLAASVALRVVTYPIITSDFTYFLSKWFDALSAAPGLAAFKSPFADYSPLYLYAMKGLTLLPFSSLYSIKTLSFFFDEMLALIACFIIWRVRGGLSWPRAFFCFTLVMALPTVMLNSTLWAQSDSIYASVVLASLYCLLIAAPAAAALLFAIAFSIKFQAIFFLPVLLGYLLRRREWLAYLLFIPLIFAASVIPAWLAGGSFSYWFFIYATQSAEYKELSLSAQSVFAYFNGLPLPAAMQSALFWAGLSIAALVALAVVILVARAAYSNPRRILLIALICALAIPFFLPRMHERYFYLADALSVVLALSWPRLWYAPALIVSASLLSYMPYLSQLSYFAPFNFDLRIPATMLALALGLVMWQLWQEPEVAPELAHAG